MTRTTSAAWRMSLLWLATAALAVFVLLGRLELSFDLSAFFPQKTNLTHDVLIEQLRSGPGSRLVVIGIKGADREQLTEASDHLRRALSADPAFVAVHNGEFDEDATEVPEPVRSYYLLMRDLDFSHASLQQAMQSRLQDLALGGGSALLDLIARDPFLATLDALEQLTPVNMSGDMWFAADGSAVLMAETRAQSIDITAQGQAIRAVRREFSTLPDATTLNLEITGVGAFSVELQKTIQAEAKKRSILASGALLLVLVVVFRNARLFLLAAIPIGFGFLAGLTLVSVLFDTVHGITLAFGFTLLGIAVDFPLHLFSHAEHDSGRTAMQRIWPTMRLGVTSTAIAYLALAFSGSQGLAQLGIFTAGGVVVAVLATRVWLPLLMAENTRPPAHADGVAQKAELRIWVAPVALLLGMTVMWYHAGSTWDDDISSLSPVPADRIAADRALRSAAVTPDMRYQLVMHNDSLEALLRDSSAVDELLADAVDDELLDDWQSISQLLPSQQEQQRRRDAIPDIDVLSDRIQSALANTPFRRDAFAPFVANAAAAKAADPLLPADIAATPLGSWLDSHLIQIEDTWVALISVAGADVDGLQARMQDWELPVTLVDLQESSVGLMRDYRNSALNTILVAALLIVGLLWYVRGSFGQTLWVALTVSAAITTTVAVAVTLHGSLTVIHLVALLLVLGLGLDYALFLSRDESDSQRRATDKGVLACAASTTLAFGILAASSIPLLRFLGLTVAIGSAASFLLAWLGSRLR